MPDWLDTKAPLLPRFLQQAGYATAHYGKWHLSNDMIPDSPFPVHMDTMIMDPIIVPVHKCLCMMM